MEVPQRPKNTVIIWSSNPSPRHTSGQNSESIHVPLCSEHLCSQWPRRGSNVNVPQQGIDEDDVVCTYNGIFCSVQSVSRARLSATPWTEARQASLSITNSQSPPKPMSKESVMPSTHLILCRPLLLPPPIPPSIRVFSNESALCIRWPKDWSLSFNISPSNEHSGLISFRMDWLDLLAVQGKGLSRVFSHTTLQKHPFFSSQLLLLSHRKKWTNAYCSNMDGSGDYRTKTERLILIPYDITYV